MFSICSWLVFGLIVGVVARAVMPGEQPMGLLRTSLLGIGGSFVGGMLGRLLVGVPASGFIGSVLGAIVLLLVFGRSGRRY